MSHQADVLVVTVTEVESKAVMAAFQEATGQMAQPEPIGDRLYLDLGEVNGARVYMALSGMGAGGVGGSQEAVRKGIESLSPAAVIMVGIAFGINEQKQAIGDVLVSDRLMLYDLQRVGKGESGAEIIPRGDRPHASPWLIDRLQMANLQWEGAKVRFGLVLSGDKLVDNVDFRGQLLRFEPEAIGGEMEGAGLYVACQNSKVDWILVKAICDWADGQKGVDKSARQQQAARNAAAFVLHALQQAPLRRDRRPEPPLPPPPPPVGEPRPSGRSSLPHQPPFFGREKELAAIAGAISPEARTWGALIDGPGGIGKTALAIRAAHLAPAGDFPLKIFLSAKVRELTPAGEQKLEDFMLPNYMALLAELARELGQDDIARADPAERANTVRRALAGQHALIVIDNVETFVPAERDRLYQFLTRLPASCKAIVTSRRRADIDARIVRLDRLERDDALALLADLAHNNRHLAQAGAAELNDLYVITHGNPLLIKWIVGQLGRESSRCRTVAEACAFLERAPEGNDPLEYIFGDLLDTFTPSETAALAALAHFTRPAEVGWIAAVAGLPETAAVTALEDLADRALLVSDAEARRFFLPPLAAAFLRRRRPEVVAAAGDRLTDRAQALALENGYDNYERFPALEANWSLIAAALPLFVAGEKGRLQRVCFALINFLDFSGRWDEWLALSREAEAKALAAEDFDNAGRRAYQAGWVYYLRGQAAEVLACADRCAAHWQAAGAGARERATAIHLRGLGHDLEKNYPAALEAFREALDTDRTLAPESEDVAIDLSSVAMVEQAQGDYAAAERHYREALRISGKINYRPGLATHTGNLADLALDREDWAGAEGLAREALALAESIGKQRSVGYQCMRIAKALARQGRPEEGRPYAERAVAIFAGLRMPENLEEARAALAECEKSSA